MFRHAGGARRLSARRPKLPFKPRTGSSVLSLEHEHEEHITNFALVYRCADPHQQRFHLRTLKQYQASSLSRRKDGGHHNSLRFMTGPVRSDTIYALSSAQGRAGIAVIRVSGPACMEVYQKLCPGTQPPKPRYATIRTLYHPDHPSDRSNLLDAEAMVLFFPAPKTVTGENLLELHVHGGSATVKAVLSALALCQPTLRYADPGEFTKRAFLHNRLDLAQVEALGDVLDAETEQQRRTAVRAHAVSSQRGCLYDSWREELLLARGEMEALIDFSEDQHLDESPLELLRNVKALVQRILVGVERHILAGARSELLRNGIQIALLGPPNVGKSSLLNLLVGREASIVSPEAGTTRDVVEVRLDIGGFLCTFADTAGIRTQKRTVDGIVSIGVVEEEGIRRARLKALSSDVVLVLASVEKDEYGTACLHHDAETLQWAARAQQRVLAVNKCDEVDAATLQALLGNFRRNALDSVGGFAEPVAISCKQAESPSQTLQERDPGGIHHLTRTLIDAFEKLISLPEDMQELLGGTERQRQLLEQCRGHLEHFVEQASDDNEPDIVLAAEHLRYAASCLAQITGRGDVGDIEEVLGIIFEKFCVGK